LDGRLVGWRHRIVGQSIMIGTALAAVKVKNRIDQTSVEGATNLPYARARYGGRTKHYRDRRATADTRGWLHRWRTSTPPVADMSKHYAALRAAEQALNAAWPAACPKPQWWYCCFSFLAIDASIKQACRYAANGHVERFASWVRGSDEVSLAERVARQLQARLAELRNVPLHLPAEDDTPDDDTTDTPTMPAARAVWLRWQQIRSHDGQCSHSRPWHCSWQHIAGAAREQRCHCSR
jgi:hypothetical protein